MTVQARSRPGEIIVYVQEYCLCCILLSVISYYLHCIIINKSSAFKEVKTRMM